ncbi:DUF3244 domain-containing protein [Robertkochia solimangrovi]|uniref:DUF3244 domain-containing protein n=1 Tax=Robertkochia solimangrovi TaxID=2213046 RepID=UPI0011800484|nr:DUF3244 domain-containing protein [Robertkochia solimangrovi]TRZ41787.1 DUF3244 domain-containing protein [Robertkochia solimangrovi]
MKKLISRIMLVALFTIATVTMARASEFYLSVKQDDCRTIDLILPKADQPLKISFTDEEGEILYFDEKSNFSSNIRRYDFNSLPNGDYFFVVESETKIAKVPLTFVEGKTIIAADKEETIYKPYFRVENKVISMNMLSIDETPVEVKVYDSSDILLYDEVLTGNKSLGKRFDFTKASRGDYKIVVKHDGNTFYKIVSL